MLKKKTVYDGFSICYKILLLCTNIFGRLFPLHVKQHWYDVVSQWGNAEDAEYISRFNGSYKYISQKKYNKDLLDKYIDIKFENYKFMAISKYDKLLSEDYGDYMKLPSEEERNPKHINIQCLQI